ALGIPALFIPYPVGNGEQALNVQDLKAAGAAIVVEDKYFNREFVLQQVIPLVTNKEKLAEMAKAAKSLQVTSGSEKLLALTNSVLVK
ncbi:MAG: hypothetical protein RIQ88_590, partial [Actinomycetota bacterium]